MKSVKYSAVSKMKKQKQQQKVQSSFIQTLKEDDQICTGLLDTLSDDYLGYLENLMGKKTAKETKEVNQIKLQTVNLTYKTNPLNQSNSNLQTNDKPIIQQKSNVQETNQEIVSSIVFLQPKPNNQDQLTKPQQQTTKTNSELKNQSKPSPINQLKSQIKQKYGLMDATSIKPKEENERRNKSEDKFLIKNIQGYLQSLSKIKQKTSLQSINQPVLSQISKKSHKSVEKQHSVTLKNINSKQKALKKSSQTITHLGQKQQQQFGRNQKKKINQIKFSKKEGRLQCKKRFRNTSCLVGEMVSESQSDEEEQIGNADESFYSLESEDNPTIPVKNRIFFGQSYKKPKRSNDESGVIKANKKQKIAVNDNPILNFEMYSQQETSLQLLVIKLITKYNKLFSTHSKCKSKIEQLQLQLIKLQQQIQLKDAEIQRLTLVNKQLVKDQQKLSLSKTNQIVGKGPHIDDRRFVQECGGVFFGQQQQQQQQQHYNHNDGYQEQHLIKMDFRKKSNNRDGKAINIEKMFVIDNLELFQKPNHYYQSQLTLPSRSKVFTVANNDSDLFDNNIDTRQKRSISCREKYKNYYNPTSQDLFNPNPNHNKTLYQRNNQNLIVNGDLFTNTPTYQKSNNLDCKIAFNNQRQRSYSESLRSQPIRYKQPDKTISNKPSNSQFSIKFKERNNLLNNNPLQFTVVSSKYLKKEHPFLVNEESQSTDSQLLQKLLSIQNSYECVKTGKSQGSKTFFK